MLKLTFEQKEDSAYRILCLGAHCDDIEIGCGGTILKLIKTYPNAIFYWVVFSSSEIRAKEAFASANLFLRGATVQNIVVKNFRNSFFPFVGAEIKEYFEEIKQAFSPDLVFTHYRQDAHQDHRLISDLAWNSFRDHLILEYEIPKYDGDVGNPNFFVHLDEAICQRKIQTIMEVFETQKKRQWFTEDTFQALLRLRGVESNSPSKYAEAFHCRKIVL
ncbi:MAG: PIG-L family deacetylase [Leptolyngbyaceae cyanobacterium CSU_1_3]|nr:PIG-L family deacetylase [Leptolyngbyaceae cyanobacterium CSU_1_3]